MFSLGKVIIFSSNTLCNTCEVTFAFYPKKDLQANVYDHRHPFYIIGTVTVFIDTCTHINL